MADEQEQAVYQLKNVSKVTVDLLYKILLKIREHDQMKREINDKYINKGENTLTDLKGTGERLNVVELNKEFASQEINLNKLKTWLEERDIEFAFNDNLDGAKELYFKHKDTDLVSHQLKKMLDDFTKRPDVINNLVKDPKVMSFE